jgi:hypothetical protein
MELAPRMHVARNCPNVAVTSQAPYPCYHHLPSRGLEVS